jgi:hypothetical protein
LLIQYQISVMAPPTDSGLISPRAHFSMKGWSA